MVNCVKCQMTLQMFKCVYTKLEPSSTKDHNKYPAKKTKSLSRKLDQIISKVKMDVTTLSKKEKPSVATIFKI